MRVPIVFALFLIANFSVAQTDSLLTDSTNLDNSEDEIMEFFDVTKVAEFPGGEMGLQRFIGENLDYPEEAIEADVQGQVMISFVIDEKGDLVDAEVINISITGGDSTDYDYCLGVCALRVFEDSPKWKPALQKDKAVKMRYRIPIRFTMY